MARSLELDSAPEDVARAMLSRACGSSRWVDRMMARRPFGRDAKMLTAARVEWFALSEPDWLEAFSHHPRIGDRAALEERFPETHELSSKEQSGIGIAGADLLTALAQANVDYFDRFGFIFIVCATGKSAAEMLALLVSRLQNDRATELRIAVEEQAKITALRLS
ncbi:MAG TPA: 2-oxo-4-hydroxy-4-carboxy-5-ureidoimidazoline decarboxylase [Vicinamibacterales bacterium]|nr:2-oxo-4-hydroxy-4-carboxy-5-ureidoimidazoline decarboxylase [Vicinamibacterales bacterium]